MKKIIVLAVFVMSVFSLQTFANNREDISPAAKEAFKQKFPGVEPVRWEEVKEYDMYIAWFVYDNKTLMAYFSKEGDMLATARIVEKDNLPFMVDQSIKRMFSKAEILKVEELAMDGRLSYFFTIETENSKIALRIFSDGTVEKIKTIKKKSSNKQ